MEEKKVEVIRPNPGSQEDFISCPYYECLYHGTRGPGKTFALILSFLLYVGKGFGIDYSGYIFRRERSELQEIEDQANILFNKLYKNRFKFNGSEHQFYLPQGERLMLCYAEREAHYWKFHGKARPYLGFDELVSWPNLNLYERLKSICRSKNKNIPLRIRSTTNSLGPGHNAVKDYFKLDSLPFGSVIENKHGLKRTNIWGAISENPYLFENEVYMKHLMSIKDPNFRKSWLMGSWQIVAGGALSDVFRNDIHIIKPFRIPKTWSIYRNLDWGSAKPYCVLYCAVSDGSEYKDHKGKVRPTLEGDIFWVSELYGVEIDADGNPIANTGTKETPTKVRDKMLLRERLLKREHRHDYIYAGVADSQIFAETAGTGENTIADYFKPLTFQKSVKGQGSRISALNLVREKLSGSIPDKFSFREEPGMFFFENCTHSLRTLPVLPRDEVRVEDIDKKAEDHAFDTIKYFVRNRRMKSFVFKQSV